MNPMIKKSLWTLSAACVLSMAIVPCVSARAVGGGAGNPQTSADEACLPRVNGGVSNICGGAARAYEVQLPYETGSTKVVTFTADNNVICSSNATFNNGNNFVTSGQKTATTTVLSPVALTGIVVSGSTSKIWLRCDLPLNGALSEVDWNP